MRMILQLGWGATFILNERQLAQLMPILETCHYVEEKYLEGKGLLYQYKEFKPRIEFMEEKAKIYDPSEIENMKTVEVN